LHARACRCSADLDSLAVRPGNSPSRLSRNLDSCRGGYLCPRGGKSRALSMPSFRVACVVSENAGDHGDASVSAAIARASCAGVICRSRSAAEAAPVFLEHFPLQSPRPIPVSTGFIKHVVAVEIVSDHASVGESLTR